MKIQIIKHKTGYLGISDEKIKIKDLFIFSRNNRIITSIDETLYIISNDNSHYRKIICCSPDLGFEGVPLIDLQTDISEGAKKAIKLGFTGEYAMACAIGFNKAKELYKFTEEDIRKAIELARLSETIEYFAKGQKTPQTNEQIIEQISKSKEPIAAEIETERQRIHIGDDGWKDTYYPKLQTINGKEHVIIKETYYE